ncbi:hypothetical protein K474DRAFT_1666868 [Panus rudis PR-1116 ss-1]|nr:hypothetical protein K474DRAFT_1666868 [Panus rudis PR-1116 ss-1]
MSVVPVVLSPSSTSPLLPLTCQPDFQSGPPAQPTMPPISSTLQYRHVPGNEECPSDLAQIW